MTDAVDTFTIERDDRTYRVSVLVDESPMNPRTEYDHSATQFYVIGSDHHPYVDELDGTAGNALTHFIERYRHNGNYWGERIARAFHLWTVITGSPVRLVTGTDNGYVQGHWHDWYALVDTDVMAREGYGMPAGTAGTLAEYVAKVEADEYAAYAFGDVFGVSVTSPEGEHDSLWGIVDREGKYVREVADEMVDSFEAGRADVAERQLRKAFKVAMDAGVNVWPVLADCAFSPREAVA